MRLVFVNHCHPETQHVCATRMREFARAMVILGHEVILFTETIPEGASETTPQQTRKKIQDHDFSAPLYISTQPKGHPLIKKLRDKKLPWGIRQVIIIWYFFLITLISSAKQCYWRDYLRPKVIRDLNRGRSPTAGRVSLQFMGVLKKRKSGGGGDIFFSSAETSQLNNLLRGSAPGLVQKGEDVHGLNSQGANDVNGAQVKPRHNARIRNANILSDF